MSMTSEIAAAAAQWVVEHGLEYAEAKRKAARDLGRRSGRGGAELPSNEEVEAQVREHLALFHADTQPAELRAMRAVALEWMERLKGFRPHVSGAVWRGTATRRSAVHLDLYCDDPKSAEIALLNLGVDFDSSGNTSSGGAEPTSVLTVGTRSVALGEIVTVHLIIRDLDELRGALKADAGGQTWRGDISALQRRMNEEDGNLKGNE